MAKVSLRIYTREIERLIEQGNTDEAIAHCRHILRTFPKHLETYRLLGKAYLEARRYGEAVDIFGRLLMAVPDDFVAHVGLSIIRDEENRLDDAIWHMQRAFEVQSANPAIQDELKRLYARRDGVEPPKVRMTRGALARMYVQGELYPQAISEIRAVLAEDPQRADMQALLALSFFKSGQKSDASDICNQLIARYPYCFDANRIMVDLLQSTADLPESTQVYRMRVGEMDPYANFVKGSIFRTDEVPDASVNLERLEYTGEEVSMDQGWASSLGIGYEAPALTAPSADDQPDWLKSVGAQDALSTTVSESDDAIPDFLRNAGWTKSDTPERPTSIFDEEPAENLVPADLPDWLKEQAPPSSAPDSAAAFAQPSPSDEAIDWLKDLEPSDSSAALETPQTESELPGDLPDWLKGLGESSAPEPAAPEADAPDWLRGLSPAEESEPPAQPADLPDWLRGAAPQAEPISSSAESLGASAAEQEDAIAWLESLAAKHGAKPEELVSDPSKRSETPPDWVAQAQSGGEAHPAAPAEAESVGASAAEQEDAIAWLESLAAKHGAKPEELVSDPSKRSETPPDWVAQAQSAARAEEPPKPDWVEGAQDVGEQFFAEFERASSVTAPKPDEADEEKTEDQAAAPIPEWLRDSVSEKESAGPEPEFSAAPAEEDLSQWLSGLDEEPGLDFDAEFLRASDRPPFAAPAQDVPVTSAPPADLPDWLQGVDEAQAVEDVPAQTGGDDIPPWLHREQWESEAEEIQPTPTSPSDWHPVVEDAEPAAPLPPRPRRAESVTETPLAKSAAPPAVKKKTPRRAKGEVQGNAGALHQAKAELDRGDIPAALEHFGKLIKKGRYLEEIIAALNDSLYRYPVEVGIWQTLGDAYMRANRLKEALDAYNKAEELIR